MSRFEKIERLNQERNVINDTVVRLEDQLMRYALDPTARYSILQRLKRLYIQDYEIQLEIKRIVGESERRPTFWNLINRI